MISGKKAIFEKILISASVGSVLGVVLGHLAKRYDWGFGYLAAIGMVLSSAFCAEIIATLSAAGLSGLFEKCSRGKRLLLQMTTSLLAHAAGWVVIIWIAGRIVGFEPLQWEVLIWLILFLAIIFISSSIRQLTAFQQELGQKDLVEERLKALAAQAELKALKAQINPHFLFNSLNTIASLISTAPPEAERAVEKLAEVFRYTLIGSEQEFVPLRKELDFIDSYLDVEKARFGNRLTVVESVAPEVLETPIPSLIIQPLVENCLKHGLDEEGTMKMEIRCFPDGDDVKIEVMDGGRGAPEDVKRGMYTRGTGLKNVNERLVKHYGDEYRLIIRDNENPGGTVAMMAIPRG